MKEESMTKVNVRNLSSLSETCLISSVNYACQLYVS